MLEVGVGLIGILVGLVEEGRWCGVGKKWGLGVGWLLGGGGEGLLCVFVGEFRDF